MHHYGAAVSTWDLTLGLALAGLGLGTVIADREHAAATLGQLPPPLRLLYRARWKPRFDKTQRW